MSDALTPKVRVEFTANGVGEVQRGLRLVGKDGEASAQRVGGSMRQIANGVEAIARQGKFTGEALKQVIASGAEMAFMFGAGGPIIGAIGIVGLAIYEHITGNIKAARDEVNKFRKDLESTDLMAAAKKQQSAFSGDPRAIRGIDETNASWIARRYGAEGVRSRIEQLRGQLPKTVLDAIGRGAGMSSMGLQSNAQAAATKEMIELVKQLGVLKQQLIDTAPVVAELADQEGKRAKAAADVEALDKAQYESAVAAAERRRAGFSYRQRLLDDPMSILGTLGVQSMRGAVGVPNIGGAEGYRAFGVKAGEIGDSFKSQFVNPLGESITKSIAGGIGDAIASGFDAAFAKGGNIGQVAAAFGGTALRTIGGVFKDIGMQSLLGLEFMQAIKLAIMTWNPAFGIAASIGLIALGSALQSAGSRAMSNATGGGGGGGYSSSGGGATVIDRGMINPVMSTAGISAMRSVTNHFVVIGQNDPVAQRTIAEMVDRGNDRRMGR